MEYASIVGHLAIRYGGRVWRTQAQGESGRPHIAGAGGVSFIC